MSGKAPPQAAPPSYTEAVYGVPPSASLTAGVLPVSGNFILK